MSSAPLKSTTGATPLGACEQRARTEAYLNAEAGLAPEAVQSAMARLDRYAALLREWQARINLIGPATVPDLWVRHVLDSLQLLPLLADPDGGSQGAIHLADLGTGAGFPGLVLAAVLLPGDAGHRVTLIDSDHRKVAFLHMVAQAMELTADRTTGRRKGGAGEPGLVIHTGRIEAVAPQNADFVTARALAPLDKLLGLTSRHLAPGGKAVLLKGEQAETELTAARQYWSFEAETHPSITGGHGRVLAIRNLEAKP